MSLRMRSALTAGFVMGLVAIAVLVWSASHSAASTAGNHSASLASPSVAGPSNNFGFSKAVQTKIDRLNAELERCLLTHGAERVSRAGGGWTYTDPAGRPSGACARVQTRVNAFADSGEYQAAVAEVRPAVEAYASCLARQGVSSVHGTRTADEQAELARAHAACGGTAENTNASG